jgi:PAS domain S-box-containing protein
VGVAPPDRRTGLDGYAAAPRRPTVLVAVAAAGATLGAAAVIWFRLDHDAAARDAVAAGLGVIAVLGVMVGVRWGEQRRWHRLGALAYHPAAAGAPGSLAAQAEAARRFVRVDGAAIVWSGAEHVLTTAATAGVVPTAFVVGDRLPPTGLVPATPSGRTPRWLSGLDPETDPGGLAGAAAASWPLPLGGELKGALLVWSARPSRLALLRLVRAARAGAPEIERARLDDAERRSRLGASHARRHLALLVSASAVLARTIDDWQPGLDALAQEVVPLHADYFAVDVVAEDGSVQRAASAHIDPALARAARQPMVEPRSWSDDLTRLLRRRLPVLSRDEHSGHGGDPDGGDAVGALHRRLALDSWAVIPIEVRGVTMGALSVGTLVPRRGLRPSDVETYEELAARCGMTLERVNLFRGSVTNERRLHTLVEASPLAIIEVDLLGALRSWNRAAVELFRWTPATVPPALPPEATATIAALRARLLAGHPVVADRMTVTRQPDGGPLSLSVAAAFVPGPSESSDDLVCILTDVTQRELLERELQQKQRMEALGRLAGGVAHDFNNLLTVIVGYSELLANRLGATDPLYADVDAIRVAGRQAAAFTEQLLTISHNRPVEVGTVDLAQAVRNLEPVLRRLVGEDVVFVVGGDRATGSIAIDEGRLEQVLLNLVVNAEDAMPEGGTLTITTGTVDGPDGRPCVELMVRDTGVGMDPATLERCFDPFFTTKGRGKGTGLGLATVYGVIDQAGGDISVQSALGRGTVFRATFPRAEPSDRTSPPPLPRRVHRRGAVDRRVLLVEDEDEVRAYARTVLDEAGFHVVEAGNGVEALELVSRLGEPPSILVTDVLMPRMGGPVLASELTAGYPDLPVLYISGYVEDQRRDELLRDRPGSRFLPKPFKPSELVRAVDDLLADVPAEAADGR